MVKLDTILVTQDFMFRPNGLKFRVVPFPYSDDFIYVVQNGGDYRLGDFHDIEILVHKNYMVYPCKIECCRECGAADVCGCDA